MIKKYPYLKDINFLNQIYGQHNKTTYALVTILDWQERKLQDVQGKVISASISVNGDSSVRRTANVSIKILDSNELYTNSDSLFAINKKVYLELGLKNNLAHLQQNFYPDYPIIYFPFGTFIIQNYSITHDNTGITVNLTLGDKMCLLNGDAGGTIPASVNFESVDTLGPDGDLYTELIPINQIIPEMVNHFGGEDLNKIIVNDIPNRIKQVLKWRGSNPLYLWKERSNELNAFYTTIDAPGDLDQNSWTQRKIIYNYDAGYTYTPFVYPGELTAGAGDSVCTVLDKIKNTLGNYEYYYDVFGNFVFQEIKNYVNVSEWRTLVQQQLPAPDGYLPYSYNPRLNTAVYSFDNSDFIVSYSNAPQLNMIKNDFIVWGIRKSSSGMDLPCRYHLAIDERPKLEGNFTNDIGIVFDTSMDDKIRRCYGITVDQEFSTLEDLKSTYPDGIVGKYYKVGRSSPDIYTWISDIDNYNNLLNNYLTAAETNNSSSSDYNTDSVAKAGYVKMQLATYYAAGTFSIPSTTNWRNILYFQGVLDSAKGLDTNYYWAELCNEWPKIYDIEHDDWIDGVLDSPSSLDWWLDIIDNDSVMNKFSVNTIGRRSYAKTDNDCNCVFEPDIPDVIIVNNADEASVIDSRSQMTQDELRELGLYPTQVSDAIYMSLTAGGTFNSCYQHVRQILTNYTDYNESITVTCLPIYHLEPNTRVFFNDPESGIYGDYMINTISFDLGNTGTMNISAKKCIEKI